VFVQNTIDCFLQESRLQLDHLSTIASRLLKEVKSVNLSVLILGVKLISEGITKFLEFSIALGVTRYNDDDQRAQFLYLLFFFIAHCN
jgi:hypothetical protein